jgi:chromosome segregation ATPase
MGQKTKFILVGFIGVALIFVFLYLQTLNSKQLIIKERDSLKNENASLASRVEKVSKDLRQAQAAISSFKAELDAVGKERDDLEKKYEAANSSKKELLEKIQAQAAQVQGASAQAPQGISQRSDDYWAAILTQKTELQMQLDSVRGELKTARVQNEELLRDKSAVELDIKGLKRQAEELQHQIEYNKKIMDSIAQELVWEKNERKRHACAPVKVAE